MIKGKVVSGTGKGKDFTQLVWARRQFIEKLGFDPYPGTLNLKLESEEDMEEFKMLKRTSSIEIRPESGDYCVGDCFKVLVENKIKGAVVIPRVKSYAPNLLEIISPINLRAALNLRHGDLVKLSVQLGEITT